MGDEEKLSTLLREGTGTTGPEGGAVGPNDADEGGLKADNTRLRQEVARLQELTQRSVPFVDAVQRMSKSALGKQVIEKLQKGESVDDLLPKEERELEKQAEKAGLSMDELKTLLEERDEKLAQKLTDNMRVSMEARDGVKALNDWASKELPGYDKIKGTPTWNGYLDAAQTAIQRGTLVLPEGKDPWQELYKRTYNMCVAEDPDVAKGTKKAAPKTPEERLAEVISSGNKPSASSAQTIDEENMPEGYKRQLEHIRKLKGGSGPSGIGLSFSNPSANKK